MASAAPSSPLRQKIVLKNTLLAWLSTQVPERKKRILTLADISDGSVFETILKNKTKGDYVTYDENKARRKLPKLKMNLNEINPKQKRDKVNLCIG